MKCKKCKQFIHIGIENKEDFMGQGYEFEYEEGHTPNCPEYRKEVR